MNEVENPNKMQEKIIFEKKSQNLINYNYLEFL